MALCGSSTVLPEDGALLLDSGCRPLLLLDQCSDGGYHSGGSLSPASSVDSCCLSPPAAPLFGGFGGVTEGPLEGFDFLGGPVSSAAAAADEEEERRPARRGRKPRSKYPGTKRHSASEREKLRMRDLTKALHHLRSYLPASVAPAGQTLTKIETLRLTIRYIAHLSAQLGEAQEEDALSQRSPVVGDHHHRPQASSLLLQPSPQQLHSAPYSPQISPCTPQQHLQASPQQHLQASPQQHLQASPQHLQASPQQHLQASPQQHLQASPQHLQASPQQHLQASPQHLQASPQQHLQASPQHLLQASPQHLLQACPQEYLQAASPNVQLHLQPHAYSPVQETLPLSHGYSPVEEAPLPAHASLQTGYLLHGSPMQHLQEHTHVSYQSSCDITYEHDLSSMPQEYWFPPQQNMFYGY